MLSSACLLTLLCLQLAPPIQGSSSLYSGRNFVTAFMEASPLGISQFELILNGIDCCAMVNVTIQGCNFFQSVTLQQGEMVNLAIPTSVMLNGSSISSAGVIVISSNSSISVISKVRRTGGYDWSYIYPVDLLDKQYYVITPVSALPSNAQFAILNLDQANSITVTLYGGTVTFQGQSFTSGSSTSFQLSPYQGAQFQLPGGDLSGSFIQANKPIAVLSGHQDYQNYPLYSYGYVFEQLLPESIWGRSFVLPPLSVQPRNDDVVLVMASQGTNLNVYNVSVVVASKSLSRGDIFVQKIHTDALWISADHDVMVMLVCSGGPIKANTTLTPFMSNVVATTDLETSQVVHDSTGFTTNLLVVTVSGKMSGTVVDGIPVPPNTTWNDDDFKTLKYSWVEVTVSPGSHYVQQLLNEHVWVVSYSFTGNATSLPCAGNTSASFNFYGSGLNCSCQRPQLVNTSLLGMTTPNTSLQGMTTPNTSLQGMTTPNTSLQGMTTPNTSLQGMTTPNTSLQGMTTPNTSLQGMTTPNTSLQGMTTPNTSLQGMTTPNTSLQGMTTPNTSLQGMTTPNTSLQGMTTHNTSSYGMTTPNTTVFKSLTTKTCKDGLADLYMMSTQLSWWDALRYCRQYYTDLFSLPDQSTQNLVATTMRMASMSKNGLWIGLRRHKVWGYLYWTDGEPTNYMNWGNGEPNDPITNMCTLISPDKNFTWMGQCCSMKLSFICY
ncbi:IgGFc-binding protein-like [Lithobates pipiens]